MKCRMNVIDSSRGDIYKFQEDIVILNLNRIVNKSTLYNRLSEILDEIPLNYVKFNLCNLASLCFKLKIEYASFKCLDLVDEIKKIIQSKRKYVSFVQENIYNYGEYDLRPFESIFSVDEEITINNILLSTFRTIGFVDIQVEEILRTKKDILKLMPIDILNYIPLENGYNKLSYEYIKELLTC